MFEANSASSSENSVPSGYSNQGGGGGVGIFHFLLPFRMYFNFRRFANLENSILAFCFIRIRLVSYYL